MNKKRNLIYILIIFFLTAGALIWLFTDSPKSIKEETKGLSQSADSLVITNLNVGKADAAFIEYNGTLGMIDTGLEESYPVIEKFLGENGISTIDYMIISHYDKDHVGSAVRILENYDVKKIYLPDYISDKPGYANLMAAIRERGDVVYVSDTETIDIGNMSLELIPPLDPDKIIATEEEIDNDMSLMCMVTFGTKKFLFAGDIEKTAISAFLDEGTDLSADWLKVPHHGGYEKNSEAFFKMISPKYAVISTGTERPADEKILSILTRLTVRTYNTTNGNVITLSDGENISVATKK